MTSTGRPLGPGDPVKLGLIFWARLMDVLPRDSLPDPHGLFYASVDPRGVILLIPRDLAEAEEMRRKASARPWPLCDCTRPEFESLWQHDGGCAARQAEDMS